MAKQEFLPAQPKDEDVDDSRVMYIGEPFLPERYEARHGQSWLETQRSGLAPSSIQEGPFSPADYIAPQPGETRPELAGGAALPSARELLPSFVPGAERKDADAIRTALAREEERVAEVDTRRLSLGDSLLESVSRGSLRADLDRLYGGKKLTLEWHRRTQCHTDA